MSRTHQKRANLPECFVISPIADKSTPERAFLRWKADYIFKQVIKPVCTELGIRALRMDHRVHNAWISDEMLNQLACNPIAVAILEAEQVSVANAHDKPHRNTPQNANVIYEIGIRHAWCREVVILSPEPPTSLPFDLHEIVPVSYPPFTAINVRWTPAQIRKTRSSLRRRLSAALKSQSRNQIQARFAKCLRQISEHFGLELVCKMKTISLRQLDDHLEQFKDDVLADYELQRNPQRACAELAKLLQLQQELFAGANIAYRRIATDQLRHVHGADDVVRLCGLMSKVSEQFAGLITSLHPRKTSSTRVAPLEKRQICKQVDSLLKAIAEAKTACQNLTGS